MKTWQIALIGVGVVATVAIVAKVVSSPSPDSTVRFDQNAPAAGPSGNVGERVATGAFSLADTLTRTIGGQVARDREIAAEERRDNRANAKGPGSNDPNYDSAADYRRKTGNV